MFLLVRLTPEAETKPIKEMTVDLVFRLGLCSPRSRSRSKSRLAYHITYQCYFLFYLHETGCH